MSLKLKIKHMMRDISMQNKDTPFEFILRNSGYCTVCDSNTTFNSYDPWLRDNYFCGLCWSVPRERAITNVIEALVPNWREKKIHESSPSPDRQIYRKLSSSQSYTVSQYFPDATFGEVVNGFRNEDLEAQTFKKNTFDIVITLDVMEHVYNPKMVFKEVSRTLRANGIYIFTVPIINLHSKSVTWAKQRKDGGPEFLHKPEHHGNPVDSEGSPVTMHWGYDIVDYIKKNSNMKAVIIAQENAGKGIMGRFNEVVVCYDKDNKTMETRVNKLLQTEVFTS